MSSPAGTRLEHDALGPVEVPAERLYGASTARAVANFPFASGPLPRPVILALAGIKQAAARANHSLGLLDSERAALIQRATQDILDGAIGMEEFPVDVFQTGSGTSSNMNVNEVVANRCAQLARRPIGAKDPVHPNDHVNRCQSSNDVFPSAIHLAVLELLGAELTPALALLAGELTVKATVWSRVLKIGRTHLQDATVVSVGQECAGWAAQAAQSRDRLLISVDELRELPLGGTAVGTGINAHPDFAAMVLADLGRSTGLALRAPRDRFAAQGARDGLVAFSGSLRATAIALSKIANDLRLLGSGPRCGLGELALPALQPGSSIMPGKVNPVVCEAVMQIAAQVIGNDAAVAVAGLGGVGSLLELNVAMPVMARNVIESMALLARGARALAEKVVRGLEVDAARCGELIERSLGMATPLVPVLGYDRAVAIAARAAREGRTVRAVAAEDSGLSAADLELLLDPRTGAGV